MIKANIMGMFDNQIVEFYDSSALVAKPLLQEKPQKLTLYTRNKDQDTNTPNFVVSPIHHLVRRQYLMLIFAFWMGLR